MLIIRDFLSFPFGPIRNVLSWKYLYFDIFASSLVNKMREALPLTGRASLVLYSLLSDDYTRGTGRIITIHPVRHFISNPQLHSKIVGSQKLVEGSR